MKCPPGRATNCWALALAPGQGSPRFFFYRNEARLRNTRLTDIMQLGPGHPGNIPDFQPDCASWVSVPLRYLVFISFCISPFCFLPRHCTSNLLIMHRAFCNWKNWLRIGTHHLPASKTAWLEVFGTKETLSLFQLSVGNWRNEKKCTILNQTVIFTLTP